MRCVYKLTLWGTRSSASQLNTTRGSFSKFFFTFSHIVLYNKGTTQIYMEISPADAIPERITIEDTRAR